MENMEEIRAAYYQINLAWMKIYAMIGPKIPIYTVQWNHRKWTFTDEKEAWLFAHYWKLL
jgi:hypothetical protein